MQKSYSQSLPDKSKNKEFNFFFENKGQLKYDNGSLASDVLFYTSLSNMDIYVTKKAILYVQKEKNKVNSNSITNYNSEEESYTITKQRFDFEIMNSNQTVKFEGIDKKPTKFNIEGKAINAYSSVRLNQIYDGVDMVLYIDKQGLGLKYDFILQPGADYSLLRFKYKGIELSERDGELIMSGNSGKKYVESIPKSYLSDGTSLNVSYATHGNNEFSYNIPTFDRREKLTIDPLFQGWSTLTGSNDIEVVNDMAYNSVGVYLVGYIEADWTTIPSFVGGTRQYMGNLDALIMNFDNQGTNTTYATPMRGDLVAVSIFGGTYEDMLTSIDVEQGTNNIIVSGHGFATTTNSFPNSGTTTIYGSFSSNGSKDAFYGYLDNNLSWGYFNIIGSSAEEASSKVKVNNGIVFLGIETTNPNNTMPFSPVAAYGASSNEYNACIISFNLGNGQINWGTYVPCSNDNTVKDLHIIGQNLFVFGNLANDFSFLIPPTGCNLLNNRGRKTDPYLAKVDISNGNLLIEKHIVTVSNDPNCFATDIESISINNIEYLLVLFASDDEGFNLQNTHLSPNSTNSSSTVNLLGVNPDGVLMLMDQNLSDIQYVNTQNVLKNAGVYVSGSLFEHPMDMEVDDLNDLIFISGFTNSTNIIGQSGRISSTTVPSISLNQNPPVDGFISIFKLTPPDINQPEWIYDIQYTNYFGGTGYERYSNIELEFNSQTNFSDVYIAGTITPGQISGNWVPPTLDPTTTNTNQTTGGTTWETFLIKCCISPPDPELVSGSLLLCYKTDFQDYYEVEDNILTTAFTWTTSCAGVRIINGSGNNRRVQIIFDNIFMGVCTVYVQAHNSCGDSHTIPIIIERKIIPDIDFVEEGPICMGQGGTTWLHLDPALNIFLLNFSPYSPFSSLELLKDGTSLGLISNLNNGSFVSYSPPLCSLNITSPGVYKLKTVDLCGNVIYSKEVAVRLDMDNTFDLTTYANGHTFTSNFTIDNTVYPGFFMGKEIRVASGTTLTIRDVSIQFAQCAYILVEADAHLIIDNSSLYSCDWWTGIIPDWATNVLGNRNITITNSTISDAECAIGLVNEVQINLNNNNFINNYWHVGTLKPFLWFGSGFSSIQLPKDVRSCDPDAYVTNYPGFTNNASMPAGNCNIINNVFQNNKSFKNTHYKSINGDGMPILSDGCSYCLELGVDYVFISAFMLVQENNISFQVNNNSFSNTWNEDFLMDLSFNDSHNSIDLNDNIFVSNDINSINANTLYSMYFVRSNIIHASNNIFSGKYFEIVNVRQSNHASFMSNSFNSSHPNAIGGTFESKYGYIDGCEFNGLNKGLRLFDGYGVLAPNTTEYQIHNNTFRDNNYALIISPVEDPYTCTYSQDPIQTYPVELKCNKFKDNEVAISGSGSINTQAFFTPGFIYEWGNDFDGNTDWNVLWAGNYTFEYFHGCSTQTETTLYGLTQNQHTMNGSNISTSNDIEYLNYADGVDICNSVWKRNPFSSTPQDTLYPKNNFKSNVSNEISIYPNPFNDELIVSSFSEITDVKVQMYDILGRSIHSELISKISSIDNMHINTSHLKPGFYLVHIKSKSESVSFKLLKK
ncbi:MAG: T9SS type A sorting domain-containing protein [Saprospiraceae bacterium]|nr:T9SS type A sorting domain-containing protein [Saprospiraceae bacterium]